MNNWETQHCGLLVGHWRLDSLGALKPHFRENSWKSARVIYSLGTLGNCLQCMEWLRPVASPGHHLRFDVPQIVIRSYILPSNIAEWVTCRLIWTRPNSCYKWWFEQKHWFFGSLSVGIYTKTIQTPEESERLLYNLKDTLDKEFFLLTGSQCSHLLNEKSGLGGLWRSFHNIDNIYDLLHVYCVPSTILGLCLYCCLSSS